MTAPQAGSLACGWPNEYVEQLSQEILSQLGVTEAVTCSGGPALRPTEMWLATNVGLIHLSTTGDWDSITAAVVPWNEVRGLEVAARAADGELGPSAVLRISSPQLELEVMPLSSGSHRSRAQQWAFVRASLTYLAWTR